MSRQVLLELPEDVADTLSQRSPEDAGKLIARAVRAIVASESREYGPVSSLTDPEVLEVANLVMPANEDARQLQLMRARQERKISDEEEAEFQELCRLYDRLLLRKSEGLVEAVKRGLMPPLTW